MKGEATDPLAALKKEVDELTQFARRLSEKLREYEMRFEALRILLLQRGTISQPDFETSLAELAKMGDEAYQEELEALHQQEEASRLEELARRIELLRERLQKHEGTKQ